MARVLVWSTAFWPMIGGAEVLGEALMAELAKRGHEILVVTDRPIHCAAKEEHNGYTVRRLDMNVALVSRDVPTMVRVRSETAALKREFQPDLIWVYQLGAATMFHRMTKDAWPAPTLVSSHHALEDSAIVYGGAVREVIVNATWLTTCSEFLLRVMRDWFPELAERSSVVLNALPLPALVQTEPSFDPPRLFCGGRQDSEREKGFDIAIDAMTMILHRHPNAQLRIAGDGLARAALERRARASSAVDHIEFLGPVSPDHIPALMRESSIVLSPSETEAFGLVALQAQQMARPVVASKVDGLPEVVADGETGILFSPHTADALASAVCSLLDNPEHAMRMGLNGRRRAEETFRMDRFVDAFDELIRKLAAGDTPAGVRP